MGDPEEVVLFIRECLNMDTVLEVSTAYYISHEQNVSRFTNHSNFSCSFFCQVIEEVEGPGAVKMEPQEDQ